MEEILENNKRFDIMLEKINKLIDEEFINLNLEILENNKNLIIKEIYNLFKSEDF